MALCQPLILIWVIERLPDPKGDRVKMTMSGKFLSYKRYNESGNISTDEHKVE